MVSGAGGGTWQSPLAAASSLTTAGKTTLRYTERDAVLDAVLVIDPVGVAVTADTVLGRIVAGASTPGAPCTATFAKADATTVEGTISCPTAMVEIHTSGTAEQREVHVAFSASR